jgi:hypothetical protein
MRFNTILLACTALALAAIAPAQAVTITGLYNTGVDGNRVSVTGVGVVDQHWTLTNGMAYVSGQNGVFPLRNGIWLADNATSRWITPQSRAGVDLDSVQDGLYFYNLGFSLAGFQPKTASFSGRFSADNRVTAIRLNGNLLAASGGDFRTWTNFAANSGFVAGANTLQFVVTNIGQRSGNPSGLRVEFTASDVTPVPEPASWAMMIAGFGLVGAAMRRRASAPERTAA